MSPEEEWQLALRVRITEKVIEKVMLEIIWGDDIEKLR